MRTRVIKDACPEQNRWIYRKTPNGFDKIWTKKIETSYDKKWPSTTKYDQILPNITKFITKIFDKNVHSKYKNLQKKLGVFREIHLFW